MNFRTLFAGGFLAVACFLAGGCSTVNTYTRAYLAAPRFAPSRPEHIEILQAEPKRPLEKLGEILVGTEGQPSRDAIEKKLREAAAKLGADAVYITADKLNIYPVVYLDWWGPSGTSQDVQRNLVAVAVKYK
jgi:hypothetical protein